MYETAVYKNRWFILFYFLALKSYSEIQMFVSIYVIYTVDDDDIELVGTG